MGDFTLRLLKNIKKKNDSPYMRFVCVEYGSERGNKQCTADIFLRKYNKRLTDIF